MRDRENDVPPEKEIKSLSNYRFLRGSGDICARAQDQKDGGCFSEDMMVFECDTTELITQSPEKT